MVECAVENQKPVRIGVNWGSLDQALLTRMMDENSQARRAAARARRDDGSDGRQRARLRRSRRALRPRATTMIILSAKVSGVRDLIDVYTKLAARCDYALHLGLTEAGMGIEGRSSPPPPASRRCCSPASATPSASSLTPKPGGDRTEEVRWPRSRFCSRSPSAASCRRSPAAPAAAAPPAPTSRSSPSRSRATSRTSMPEWRKKYPGVEELKLAVMGCVVNGPGESKHANLGISLPGTFEEPKAPVYVDGKLFTTLRGDTIVAEFKQILDDYVETHYGARLAEPVHSA